MTIRTYYISSFNLAFIIIALGLFCSALFRWIPVCSILLVALLALFHAKVTDEGERRQRSLNWVVIAWDRLQSLEERASFETREKAWEDFMNCVRHHKECWPGDRASELRQKYLPLYYQRLNEW